MTTRGRNSRARTYVLVHGGFHGGWCWRFVAEQLRQKGHSVTTPTQTGLGERAHLLDYGTNLETFVTDVEMHLIMEDLHNVVLVGHSFGGNAITGVADRIPERIAHLVYLDALIPKSGKSPLEMLDPASAEQRTNLMVDTGAAKVMEPLDVTAFGIPEGHPHAEWARERITPHPATTYSSSIVLDNPVGNGLPATYICSVDPYYPALAPTRTWVREHRAEWEWVEIKTSHDSMIVSPEMTAEALLAVGR